MYLVDSRASEHYIEVDEGIFLWYRIWGNRKSGVPVLFVHGGPGQAVVDYENGNKRFFDASELFVVEIDQRGTGRSTPSVRDDLHNMKLYDDISVDLISKDFEVIRKELGIEQWMVWGGSFGSTIALDYGMQFPERCLALILRGIYLDTVPEVYSVYSSRAFRHNKKRLQEFQVLFQLANDYNCETYGSSLNPDDALALMQVYEAMIQKGRKDAIWNWFAFENNLMEERPEKLLDPSNINESLMPEAQSVAYFELRLWLHASLEQPTNILQRVNRLSDTPVFICQGLRDEVCPPENARLLAEELEDVGAPLTAHFLNAGHEDTDPVMEECLKRTIQEFREQL
ncbi:MAG: hypothetical protein SGBAC_002746 [Bacillariaceae sp.]